MLAFLTAAFGFAVAIKDAVFKLKLFDRRNKDRRKGQKNMLIGKLSQQIKDMGRQVNGLMREVRIIRPKLEKCQIERATCNANYSQLMKRVASLERRVP